MDIITAPTVLTFGIRQRTKNSRFVGVFVKTPKRAMQAAQHGQPASFIGNREACTDVCVGLS